ncbi:MAG: TetR family transcriptional regulator [Ruminococcaceae bacterium]|nr:TetR family transcriptional regulator [Oscillospiraceae bacterium]
MKPTAKQAIQASFRTLLMAKSLDKITVRDIVEDCGITRNTFYYHYEDIYDLFDDYLDTRIYETWQELPKNCPWDQALSALLESIFETPRMGRHIFYSKKQDAMRQYLNKLLSSILQSHAANVAHRITFEDRKMICDACCYALYGMLEQWLTGPDAGMLHHNLQRLLQCFSGAIHQAFAYCVDHPQSKEDIL